MLNGWGRGMVYPLSTANALRFGRSFLEYAIRVCWMMINAKVHF